MLDGVVDSPQLHAELYFSFKAESSVEIQSASVLQLMGIALDDLTASVQYDDPFTSTVD